MGTRAAFDEQTPTKGVVVLFKERALPSINPLGDVIRETGAEDPWHRDCAMLELKETVTVITERQ